MFLWIWVWGTPVTNDRTVSMPFGKHEGEELEDIPSGYLKWALEEFEDDDELIDLCEAIESELDYRTNNDAHFWE